MPFKSLNAAKFALKRLNMAEDDLNAIETLDDANEMFAVMEAEAKKNAAISKEDKKLPLPEVKPIVPSAESKTNAKPTESKQSDYSAEELFDPLQTDISRLNRYNDDDEIRILKVYDDETPEGRIF